MKHPLLSLLSAIVLSGGASAATLTIELEGVEARGGSLYISVQTEAQFMKDEGTAGEIVDAPQAGTFSATYDVPEGRYAVSIWHDDNGNGSFDTGGPFGMPEDGWAMHNSAALLGPPTFEATSVEVTSDGAIISEKMIYGR